MELFWINLTILVISYNLITFNKGRVHKTKTGKSLVFCQTPLDPPQPPRFGIFMKNIKFQCVFWPFLGHF